MGRVKRVFYSNFKTEKMILPSYFVSPGIPAEAFHFDPEDAIERCAKLFDTTVEVVKSKSRSRGYMGAPDAVNPRQLAFSIIKARTKKDDPKGWGMPLEKVGALFNGKDHSTVIHGIRQVCNALEVDEDYRDLVDPLLEHYKLKYVDLFKCIVNK